MLAQQQTEKILELLNNRVGSKFEKKPINENIKNLGFKPIKLIDFAKKDLAPFSHDVLEPGDQLAGPNEPDALTSLENDQSPNTNKMADQARDLGVPPSENSEVSDMTDSNENSGAEQVISEDERKQAYEEGYSAGFAAAESASEGDVISTLDHLNKILQAIESSDVFNKEYIKNFILEAIEQKTIQLIGYCVDELPEKFHQQIQEKLDRFSYLNDKKFIKINPKDYEAIRDYAHLYQGEKFECIPFEDLDRGSIVIEVGNINYKE